MADIFISYSSKDERIANEICVAFENEGLNCWIAPRNIQVGKEYGGEIIKGIEGCKVFFLCLSKSSNESQHVLREVERAVNRKLPIIVYQHEETVLSKSLEYFLASTQWFVPNENNDMDELLRIVKELQEKSDSEVKSETATAEAMKTKKKSRKWLWSIAGVAVVLLIVGLMFFLKREEKEIVVGDVFTYGSMDLTGNSPEVLDWLVLDVNEEEETVLCIAENVVAFFPYDGAESGMRAQDGDEYFNQEKLSDYTDEQLVNFWGSSDWETANIRSWLNSDAAIVEYAGAKPTEDAASLYENGYESEAGFLYAFSEDEKNQLVLTDIETSQDKVFLLSKEEVEKYLIGQNLVLSAVPTENAVLLEGTGIYQDYYEQGERATYWGLRTQGDNVCSVLCVGTGLGESEIFHSEYACSSLMGVRPAIVLPLEYVQTLEMK